MLVGLVVTGPRLHGKDEFLNALRREFPSVRGIFLNIQKAKTHVILGEQWIRLWGESSLMEEINGLSLRFSPGSFFQVNTQMAETLYARAVQEMELSGEELVVDVYCGVGALTLMAALKAHWVLGLEMAPSSIQDARQNAQLNKIKNVEFVLGPAERALWPALKKWEGSKRRRIAVIDPPRSGCDPNVLNALISFCPERLLYISCHPATLARDLKILSPHFQLVSVVPFDLFPQTSHVETLAVLKRRGG